MVSEKSAYNIVKSIITLAHNLEIQTVAEGVETQKQFDLLKDLGYDTLQGYLLYKPIPANEFKKLILSQ